MSSIISIGTALPQYRHQQMEIARFMERVYAGSEGDQRRLRYLYQNSGIDYRYSVLPDFSLPVDEWKFFPQSEALEPFPSLEQRQAVYNRYAPQLSVDAIRQCLKSFHDKITHLITVSCTGLSAPGLDVQIMELMDFDRNIFRTSINFMGCFAGIHALKLANAICCSDASAAVLIVCTELCTLHFQREATVDNIISSLLFGDGAAAALIVPATENGRGLKIENFYSEVLPRGRRDMAWEISSRGFLMTLSGYVPELIDEEFKRFSQTALERWSLKMEDVSHWCIHPGGRRILEAVKKSLHLQNGELGPSFEVLRHYGNLSSASIFFVLKEILSANKKIDRLFGAAFGPGLTIETFTARH